LHRSHRRKINRAKLRKLIVAQLGTLFARVMARLLGVRPISEHARPTLPPRIKVDVVIRQEGKCACGCNKKLICLDDTEFHHNPPLALRRWNSKLKDFEPLANDPAYITALRKTCHDLLTRHPRGPHTIIDSDQHSIAHTDRLQAKYNGFWKRKSPPMGGSKTSRFKKKLNGRTELRT
jgi:hypothetical protein